MDAVRASVVEALRQVVEGADIPAPETLLRNVSNEKASLQLPFMPYSILTNIAHADFWQQVWLDRLEGRKAKSFVEDWKVPAAEEWPAIRSKFLKNLRRATEIAGGEPFEHKMKSDEVAVRTLLQIAVHTSYHVGQVNLLKRAIRLDGLCKKESLQES